MHAQHARVAALTAAIGCWVHMGSPIDVALTTFLLAAISVFTEEQGKGGKHGFIPGMPWLCDHHTTVVAVSVCFATFSREMPIHTQLARSCTLLVGEIIAAVWRADAAEDRQEPQHRAQEPQTPPSHIAPPIASRSRKDYLASTAARELTTADKQTLPSRIAPPIASLPLEEDLASTAARELTTADKRAFASQQFQAAFRPVVSFLVAVLLVTVGLAAGDPALRTWATMTVPALTTLISFRTWLHWMDDQQQARLLFGYGAIGFTTINHICRYANADGHMSAAAFLCFRVVLALIQAFYGLSALPISHRVACATIVAGASLVHPPFSEIGRPLEPILTCSALLLGTLLGFAVESHLISRPKQGTPLADFPNTLAASRELTAADERIFASQQFQAAFLPLLGLLAAVVLVAAGLAVGDPAESSWAAVVILLFITLISLRSWLHWMDNQQRARLLCGYAFVVLILLFEIAVDQGRRRWHAWKEPSAAAFLCFRVVVALLTASGGYSALPVSHLVACAAIVAGASIFLHPIMSEIGRPLEPILTCSALLLGGVVGSDFKDALWRSFKERQIEKRLRREAQRLAWEAEERQRAAEAEGVAFKLATAKANRTADSQLNHMIKGLCGGALNWLHFIVEGGHGEQCTGYAQLSIGLLEDAIEWTHHRQVLVSLADGTYMSRRSECDLQSFLAEKLTAGECTVQVLRLTPLLLHATLA